MEDSMKTLLLIFTSLVLSTPAWALFGITTVPNVDLGRFVGTWYRIASAPVIFDSNCACARQILAAQSDGKVSVDNICRKGDPSGEIQEVAGYATADDDTHAKLSVHFQGIPWPGSYWIVALDPNYNWAAVSDLFGYSLYLMARTPTLDAISYLDAVDAIDASHVNTSNLQMEVQEGCHY